MPSQIDAAHSAIIDAYGAYETAISNWNGDNDGPKDRADEKLESEIRKELETVAKQSRIQALMDMDEAWRLFFGRDEPGNLWDCKVSKLRSEYQQPN